MWRAEAEAGTTGRVQSGRHQTELGPVRKGEKGSTRGKQRDQGQQPGGLKVQRGWVTKWLDSIVKDL